MTPRLCSVEGCAQASKARTLCHVHYMRLYAKAGGSTEFMPALEEWVNPLVCVCATTAADPRVNYGECPVCRRKPLALFRILREREVA